MRKFRGLLFIVSISITITMGAFLAHITNIIYRNRRIRVFKEEDTNVIDLLKEIQSNLNYLWIIWGVLLIVTGIHFVIFLKDTKSIKLGK